MLPETVGHHTELDASYAEDLKKVKNNLQFYSHLKRWQYWLDEDTKNLKGTDWQWISPLLEDCRNEMCCPSDLHTPAIKLAMPEKIVYVTMVANEFNIPWGAAYLRLREV